jgi:hypothetical protein
MRNSLRFLQIGKFWASNAFIIGDKKDKNDLTSSSSLRFSLGSSADPYLNRVNELPTRCMPCLRPISYWLRAWLILRPWKWRQCVPPKWEWISKGLHGVISQKKVLFTDTVMRTSNPKKNLYDFRVCVVNKTITPSKQTFTSRLGFERVKEVM